MTILWNYKQFVWILSTCYCLLQTVSGTWWQLGMPTFHQSMVTASVNPKVYGDLCQNLSDKVKGMHSNLCQMEFAVLRTIAEGASLSFEECKYQFQRSRWNCTTFGNSDNVFGKLLEKGTRETAYVHAVSAAGVAYSITRACTKGSLHDCSCDERVRTKKTGGKFQWGGCSEDIRYGAKFSKDFVDKGEDNSTAQGLMNLHNNEAGRRALRSNVEKMCKCHGVSGSCSVKVCWRRLKPFRQVGDELRRRFDGATRVQAVSKQKRLKLRPLKEQVKKPSKRDMVYLEDSPNYCTSNEELGILGTAGRYCNKTSPGMDGCRLLCCDRGYHTISKQVVEKCNCKFVWCCKVECQTCPREKEEYICK